MKWTLKAISEELNNSSFSLHEDTLVGRHQSCNLVLQSSEISRRHAAFYIKGQALWLEDLGSSNGTYINDVKITEPTLLKNEDIIQFASLKFLLNEIQLEESINNQESPIEAQADEGMPHIVDRVKDTPIAHDGTPENIQIPKPAPIPKQADTKNIVETQSNTQVSEPKLDMDTSEKNKVKRNASLGLVTIIVLIIIALVAWFFLK